MLPVCGLRGVSLAIIITELDAEAHRRVFASLVMARRIMVRRVWHALRAPTRKLLATAPVRVLAIPAQQTVEVHLLVFVQQANTCLTVFAALAQAAR